ncbi:MAG TPA: PorV/PorQ family protein, partial [Caldithrix sp.]|nr:PorV/PorQ family protein [Caldithrix sp.]
MKYIKFTLFIFLGVFHSAGAQLPVSSAGGASVLFLRSGLSARVTGLGEAFTALADDENSLYYNPAGLFRMANTRFTLNHTQWFEDIKFDNLSFGYRIRDRAGIAFGISHMWMPQIQGKNEIGQNTGKLSVSSSIFQVGIGFPVLDNVYGGATVKYFSDNLASYVSSGFALDVGVFVYTIIPELTFGASVQNLGAKVKYNEASQDLPLTLRAGLAYSIPQSTINLSVDVLKSQGSGLKVNMGG